jgi:N6-L-threonylcarbamoyladenine synthase
MNDQAVTSAMPDLCAGYQEAIIAQLESKFKAALEAGNYRSAGLSGGVANNRTLRLRLERTAQSHGIRMLIAQPKHCGDNAGMIAFAAMADAGLPEGARVTADPSLIVESV